MNENNWLVLKPFGIAKKGTGMFKNISFSRAKGTKQRYSKTFQKGIGIKRCSKLKKKKIIKEGMGRKRGIPKLFRSKGNKQRCSKTFPKLFRSEEERKEHSGYIPRGQDNSSWPNCGLVLRPIGTATKDITMTIIVP